MTRGIAWITDALSRTLDADEREAVLGDLAESGAGDVRALCEVAGLSVRRQAQAWSGPRPWLPVLGIALPVGWLLSVVSNSWSDLFAVDAYAYATHWTSYIFRSPGARADFTWAVTRFVLLSSTLILWSWSGGFVLGLLGRRSAWAGGLLFTMLVFGASMGSTTMARTNPYNAGVFSTGLGSVLPVLLRIDLVVLPALSGVRQGARGLMLPFFQTMIWAAAILALTGWAMPWLNNAIAYRLPAGFVWQGVNPARSDPWRLWACSAVVAWPAAYLAVTSAWQRARTPRSR
jgi:hypothetical protein